MRAGYSGRIAISWTQTELDGLEAAPRSYLQVGAAWSWRGRAVSLADASQRALEVSGQATDFTGTFYNNATPQPDLSDPALGAVVLTNGAQSFTALLFSVTGEAGPVLVFENGCPARDQEFWVSAYSEYASKSETIGWGQTIVAFQPRLRAGDDWHDAPAIRVSTAAE